MTRAFWLAISVFVLTQRPPVLEQHGAEEASLRHTELAPPVFVAVTPVDAKRLSSPSADPIAVVVPGESTWLAPAFTTSLTIDRTPVTTTLARARLRANPSHGPPVAS